MFKKDFKSKEGKIVGGKSLKSLFVLLFLVSLAGCATTKKDMSAGEPSTRISQLEEQLQQKDEEINDLKDELQNAKQEGGKRKDSFSGRRTSDAADPSSKKDGILRVDAAADQVQLALKNAGYYTGPVDGKLGEKTKKAAAEFQKAHNLNADGVIGKKTWMILKTYLK